ncbi:type IV fimbriae assembly protein [Gammaproteobacteria bacterium]|nr:type IV fimbriae assembly protein [Gammaproteobacteria bacterium]
MNNPSQKMIPIIFKEANHLAEFYMPFLKNGGFFIPTDRPFKMGDELFLVVTLPDDLEKRSPAQGQVVWITPAGAATRKQGVGLHFTGGQARDLNKRCKAIIAKATRRALSPTL